MVLALAMIKQYQGTVGASTPPSAHLHSLAFSLPGRCIDQVCSACLRHGEDCLSLGAHSGPFSPPSVHRREVQEYIPAQLYRTTVGSTWLNLVSQHRQQTQALSPHQARAQFLGKSCRGGEVIIGGFAEEGGHGAWIWRHLFLCTKAFFSAGQAEHLPGENMSLQCLWRCHLGSKWPWQRKKSYKQG